MVVDKCLFAAVAGHKKCTSEVFFLRCISVFEGSGDAESTVGEVSCRGGEPEVTGHVFQSGEVDDIFTPCNGVTFKNCTAVAEPFKQDSGGAFIKFDGQGVDLIIFREFDVVHTVFVTVTDASAFITSAEPDITFSFCRKRDCLLNGIVTLFLLGRDHIACDGVDDFYSGILEESDNVVGC